MGQFLDEQSAAPKGKFLDEEQSAPAAAAAPTKQPNAISRGYSKYIAEPLTSAITPTVGRLTGPFVDLARIIKGEPIGQVLRYNTNRLESGAVEGVEPQESQSARPFAEAVVPQTPTQAAIMAGTIGAPPLAAARFVPAALRGAAAGAPALTRILGGTVGGAVGGGAEDPSLGGVGKGAAVGAASTVLGEALGAAPGLAGKYGPGAKAAQAERLARGTRGVLETTVPEMAPTIAAAERGVSPLTRGGRTAAALEETALGESGKNTLGNVMEQGMLDATLANRGRGIQSPVLRQVWDALPEGTPIAQQLKNRLAPDPNGNFSVGQAERLLAELGEAAYKGEAASPIARGIGGLELREAYRRGLQEALQGMGPAAADVFAPARDKFKGGNWLLEMIRNPGSRQAAPNRISLNEPGLQKFASENRAEGREKLGQGFDALSNMLFNGGQIGTRSIMTPGTGETMSALRQVYGRGQGGAPQIAGSLARTAAPNLGYQPTGQLPEANGLRMLLDLIMQRKLAPGAADAGAQ